VRGSQASAAHAGAEDGLADAEVFPQATGRQHDTEFEDSVDIDFGNGGLAAGWQGVGGIGVDDASMLATRRRSAARSSWSARPKLWITRASERLASAFQSFSARA
jgi:hypothetical protein